MLLVDATADGGAARALGLTRSPRKGVATRVEVPGVAGSAVGGTRLTLLELGTEASLDEYVRLNFKMPIAPRSLGPVARIFDFVATAAPAVREILTIGKIGHEVKNGPWDLVVVDAPATGHVVELLGAPRALRDLVGGGPLAADTRWLSDLLADRATSAAIAVTLAEELPRAETGELLARIDAETDVAVGGLVVNRVPPLLTDRGRREAGAIHGLDPDDDAWTDGADEGRAALRALVAIALDRHRTATAELQNLADLGLPTVVVPEHLDGPLGPLSAVVAALADGAETEPEAMHR